MNGFKVVQVIRLLNTDVPIIAISATVWEAEQLNSLKNACHAFLLKPVEAAAGAH